MDSPSEEDVKKRPGTRVYAKDKEGSKASGRWELRFHKVLKWVNDLGRGSRMWLVLTICRMVKGSLQIWMEIRMKLLSGWETDILWVVSLWFRWLIVLVIFSMALVAGLDRLDLFLIYSIFSLVLVNLVWASVWFVASVCLCYWLWIVSLIQCLITLVKFESFHVYCLLALLLEIIDYGLLGHPIGLFKIEYF